MATGSILLSTVAATMPDGSASNAAPAAQRVKSSAAAPSLHFIQLAFDAATSEMCYWTFRMPADYASASVLKVQYKMASATSGNVIIAARIAAISDGDATDTDAKALGTVNTSGATAVPGTAGHIDEISLTMTNADSLAAGDWVTVQFERDADNASDTATGDMELIAASLEYTTT
jgi:hypothetical protein